ncbi:hypothetical protein Alsa3_CDS0116 [Staphylococcus phage Alsa_3]|nr:hypothetical protein Alsa3_CDS0116 [Staphylococcus phage Alsa_3]WNM51242.1 hypothetical protein Alsa4_CDS0112 [Staphylococcus phage Alsa_4]
MISNCRFKVNSINVNVVLFYNMVDRSIEYGQ